jgi:hypothetical protein
MLIAAVVLCIALTLVNLVLSLGMIRRLRVHNGRLDDLARVAPRPEPMTGPGTRPLPFTASPINASPITDADLGADTVVAFFSPTCDSCDEWVPKFVDAVKAMPSGASQALAVVVADTPSAATAMVSQLRQVAMVAIEPDKGPLATAFKVTGYPAMCRFDADGRVATYQPAEVLAVPAAA